MDTLIPYKGFYLVYLLLNSLNFEKVNHNGIFLQKIF